MIGIFDSGLGGLTSVKALHAIVPLCDISYFGDTGRVPYGTRSREILIKYSMQDMRFLMSLGVNAVLTACGTVSSNCLDELRTAFDIPIIGVVEGASLKAASVTKNGIIGIIGTGATINSGAFERELHKINPYIKVIPQACPLFVPLVENGFIGDDDEVTELVARRYLDSIDKSGADTLILGCTHFPIITRILQKVLPNVTMINSGAEAAALLATKVNPPAESGSIRYYISDEPDNFRSVASIFLEHELTDPVQKIDIEKY